MEKIENVSIVKKANVYFEGKVTSRTILFADGTRKTLGIILPGQYEFGTEDKEIMEVLSGTLEVQFPDKKEWVSFGEGQTFEVPEKSSFKVATKGVADYCCSYVK